MPDTQRMHAVQSLVDQELATRRVGRSPLDVYGGTPSEVARHPLTPSRPFNGPLRPITFEEARRILFKHGHLVEGKALKKDEKAALRKLGYTLKPKKHKAKKTAAAAKKAPKKTAAKKTAAPAAKKAPKKRAKKTAAKKAAKKTAAPAAKKAPKKAPKKRAKKTAAKKAAKKTAAPAAKKAPKKRTKKTAAPAAKKGELAKISHTAAVEKAKALNPKFVGKGGRILKPGHDALACAGFEAEPKQKRGGKKAKKS